MYASSGSVDTDSSRVRPRTTAPLFPAPAVMSVDVEDWFQVENLKDAVPRATWESRERRVERNTMRILELLEHHGARATFFTLGWIAERHPALVRQITDAGHELA